MSKVTTTNFWTDSDSSVKLHKDQYACKKSKHIIRVISMLRQWILNLVYAICFIPGVKNYADILTKPLSLGPFARFRDAILSAQVVLPSRSASDQSDSFVSRLTQYLNYANSLADFESPCSEHCWICHACDDALSPLLSAGGGVKPCESNG